MINIEILQKQCAVLQAIQQELINKNTPFQYIENPEDSINKNDGIFIWIGARDGYIGHNNCHYEVIFNNETPDKLSVEVHFAESKINKNIMFEKAIKGHKKLELLENWTHDNGFRRIVYKDKIPITTETDKSIVNKTLDILKELDSQIGNDLVQIVKQSKWNKFSGQKQTKLSMKNGALSPKTKTSPTQVRFSKKKYNCAHEAVENKLKEILEKKYNDIDGKKNIVLTERSLKKIKPDILVYTNKKYDIFEVKAYKNPIDCINEALGQILVYSYMLSSNNPKYPVNKLYIVGPNKADRKTKELLCHINQKYGLKKLSYITPEEIE